MSLFCTHLNFVCNVRLFEKLVTTQEFDLGLLFALGALIDVNIVSLQQSENVEGEHIMFEILRNTHWEQLEAAHHKSIFNKLRNSRTRHNSM
jgi:hypothetical protein